MIFFTEHELHAEPESILESLEAGDGLAVITQNGKPAALMLALAEGENYEEFLRAFRQVQVINAAK